MHYDLTDLRMFLALARTLNMAAAAVESGRSTAALSQRLKKFESEVGTPLFVREARGLALTTTGHALKPLAEEVLATSARMESALAAFQPGSRPVVRIASNTSGIQNHLLPAVGAFLHEHAVRLVFLERQSRAAVEAVLAGEADLAFSLERAAREFEPEAHVVPFAVDRHVLVAQPDHPLAREESVRLRDIIDFPYVGLPETAPMGRAMRERTRALGLRYEPAVEVPSFSLMLRLVLDGAGIAVVPRSALRPFGGHEALSVVRIEEPWALRPLVFAYAAARPPVGAARDFLEFLGRDGRIE